MYELEGEYHAAYACRAQRRVELAWMMKEGDRGCTNRVVNDTQQSLHLRWLVVEVKGCAPCERQ